MKTLLLRTCFVIALFVPALAAAENAQQQKMKDCNVEAKQQHLQGKDLKTFMSGCLSGKTGM